MKKITRLVLLIVIIAAVWRGCGWHVIHSPTEDQLYGCTVEQQASNGECP